MNENQSLTLEEVLRQLEEAKMCIAHLEEKLEAKDLELHKQSEEITAQKNEIKDLKEQLSSLLGYKFSKRAEDYVPEIKVEEFNKESISVPLSAENPKEKPIFKEHDKSKRVYLEEESARPKTCGRGIFGPDIPQKEQRIKLPESKMYCKCGARLRVIGEETTEKFVFPKIKAYVRHIVREKCQCPKCEGITYSDTSVVKTAPHEKTIFPKAMITPSVVSHIICNKFDMHIPYYRQEYAFKYRHLNISRENMTNWQETAAAALEPLREIFHEEVISGNVIHADETPVKVINQKPDEIRNELGVQEEAELKDREKCYIWVLMSGKENHPILQYNFR